MKSLSELSMEELHIKLMGAYAAQDELKAIGAKQCLSLRGQRILEEILSKIKAIEQAMAIKRKRKKENNHEPK